MRKLTENEGDFLFYAFLVILAIIYSMAMAGCNKPHCAYQEDRSCQIYTDGNEEYVTFMVKGWNLCCWYTTFERCNRTDDQLQDELIDWYGQIVNDNPECLIDDENCGPSCDQGK